VPQTASYSKHHLQQCHEADPFINTIKPVALLVSLKFLTFRLWDEPCKVFVAFAGQSSNGASVGFILRQHSSVSGYVLTEFQSHSARSLGSPENPIISLTQRGPDQVLSVMP
jgi:hypothetical protein